MPDDFCSNVGELVPFLVWGVSLGAVPFRSSMQVLAIDLGTDMVPAIALGTERAEPGTMSRPPGRGASAMGQVGAGMAMRTDRRSVFSVGLLSNRFLLAGHRVRDLPRAGPDLRPGHQPRLPSDADRTLAPAASPRLGAARLPHGGAAEGRGPPPRAPAASYQLTITRAMAK